MAQPKPKHVKLSPSNRRERTDRFFLTATRKSPLVEAYCKVAGGKAESFVSDDTRLFVCRLGCLNGDKQSPAYGTPFFGERAKGAHVNNRHVNPQTDRIWPSDYARLEESERLYPTPQIEPSTAQKAHKTTTPGATPATHNLERHAMSSIATLLTTINQSGCAATIKAQAVTVALNESIPVDVRETTIRTLLGAEAPTVVETEGMKLAKKLMASGIPEADAYDLAEAKYPGQVVRPTGAAKPAQAPAAPAGKVHPNHVPKPVEAKTNRFGKSYVPPVECFDTIKLNLPDRAALLKEFLTDAARMNGGTVAPSQEAFYGNLAEAMATRQVKVTGRIDQKGDRYINVDMTGNGDYFTMSLKVADFSLATIRASLSKVVAIQKASIAGIVHQYAGNGWQ